MGVGWGVGGGGAANSKHWFTTSFLYEGRCRKVMLGVGEGRGGRCSPSPFLNGKSELMLDLAIKAEL